MGNLLSSGVISPTIPPSSDGEILSNAVFSSPAPSSWENVRYPLTAFAEIYLPLSAKDLFFIARGSTSAGEVVIKEEEEEGEGQKGGGEKKSAGGVVGEARVVVEVRFRDVDDLDYMTVVKLRRTGGGEGVGIYTPNRPFIPRPPLVFYTTIYLPSSAPASLLASLSLETITSNTSHSISLPSSSTDSPISSLSLLTSNQPITFTSSLRTLSYLSAKTSNAPVHSQGDFTASSIQIITSNQPVRADKTWRADKVKVVTSNAAVEILEEVALPEGGKLELVSSNGPINVQLASFSSPSSSSSSPSATSSSSKIETSNSSIHATLLSPSSSLNSLVRTSNGSAEVVHRGGGFNGSRFEGRTSGLEGTRVEGEVGIVKKGEVDGRVWGKVEGGVGAGGGGKTEVVSSNGPVVLRFE